MPKYIKEVKIYLLAVIVICHACNVSYDKSHTATETIVYPQRVVEFINDSVKAIADNDIFPLTLKATSGTNPLILDMGPEGCGGYPIFNVKSYKGQPTLRISYACWLPFLADEEMGKYGDFVHRDINTYLNIDLPVLPGNPYRHELYTISRTGNYVAPLIQGQQRWVRLYLDTPGEVELEWLGFINIVDTMLTKGAFECSNSDLNKLWQASAYTAKFSSIDDHDSWTILNGKLVPRKLEHGLAGGLLGIEKGWDQYRFSFDVELRRKPDKLQTAWMVGNDLSVFVYNDGRLVIDYNNAKGYETLLSKKLDINFESETPRRLKIDKKDKRFTVRVDDDIVNKYVIEKAQKIRDFNTSGIIHLYPATTHPSKVGWMVGAQDNKNGLVGQLDLNGKLKWSVLENNVLTEISFIQLPEALTDGKVYRIDIDVGKDEINTSIDGQQVHVLTNQSYKGTIGFYMRKGDWALIDNVQVNDVKGEMLFEDRFDEDLRHWQFTKTLPFITDGALRDRTPWLGDMWWADRTVYYAYDDYRYIRGALKIFNRHQNPEGYVWATAYPENIKPPQNREYGYWPSDEFSLWYVPVIRDYWWYTGDEDFTGNYLESMKRNISYHLNQIGDSGLYLTRREVSNGIGISGGDFGGDQAAVSTYTNILCWKMLQDAIEVFQHYSPAEPLIARWSENASHLKANIFLHLFNSEDSVFMASADSKVITSSTSSTAFTANGLALASGFLDEHPGIAGSVIQNIDTILNGGKRQSLAVEGNFKFGYDLEAINSLLHSNWVPIMNDKRGIQATTWESTIYPPFRPAGLGYRSMAHPDTGVGHLLSEYILGIRPAAPGFKKWTFHPHFAELKHAKGKVPTRYGVIDTAWKMSHSGQYICEVYGPAGTTGTFLVPLYRGRTPKSVVVNGMRTDQRSITIQEGIDNKIELNYHN